MSNLLVSKNYTVIDHTKWYNDRSHNSDQMVSGYDQMELLMTASAQRHLQDLDEVIVHRGEAENIREVFRIHFQEIHELWKQGHDILYCDLDVLFMKPVKFFGEHNLFSMFNLTDPPRTVDQHYGVSFDFFFNCGIRYYPKNMDQSVWDLGFEMLDNWNPDRWDSEQVIYNAMMYHQDTDPQKYYDPRKAFQLLQYPTNHPANQRFNQIDLSEAAVAHFHGSRDTTGRLAAMKRLSESDNQTLVL
jgi:hypothetical protein